MAISVNARSAETISGTIKSFTTAPRGEVDGAVLGDGTVIHWPPHTGDSVSSKFKKGDRVEVTGDKETGPAGDSHFEVQSLKSDKGDVTLDVAAIGPPPRGPRPPREDFEQKTIRGQIERFTTAPRGEVDGAVLDDKTVLHWPPHMGEKMKNFLAKQDRVEALGHEETGPRGDSHFEVEKVTNLKNDKSLAVEGPPHRGPGPRPPRDHANESPSTVSGVVNRLTQALRGEVDGAVLEDGTVLHWPPHRERDFVDDVRAGEKVTASGWHETGPEGDKRFEVDSVLPAGKENTVKDAKPGRTGQDREQRLRELQSQLEKIQAEIEELRHEK